jgi:hypothetical protein
MIDGETVGIGLIGDNSRSTEIEMAVIVDVMELDRGTDEGFIGLWI